MANEIMTGEVVPGLEPQELVKVRKGAPFGAKTLVGGRMLQTKREIKGFMFLLPPFRFRLPCPHLEFLVEERGWFGMGKEVEVGS